MPLYPMKDNYDTFLSDRQFRGNCEMVDCEPDGDAS